MFIDLKYQNADIYLCLSKKQFSKNVLLHCFLKLLLTDGIKMKILL